MTSVAFLRPALPAASALLLAACGGADDGRRFETMAEHVAAIDLSPGEAMKPPRTAAEAGLRPGEAKPLRVELLTPHELWDARDGLQRAVIAAPQAVEEMTEPETAGPPTDYKTPAQPGRAAVQLGAYGSEASARDAWARLASGAAAIHLEGLDPAYEAVEVGGRRLVRLKVEGLSAERAAALCATVAANDPWCVRAARPTGASTGSA